MKKLILAVLTLSLIFGSGFSFGINYGKKSPTVGDCVNSFIGEK